MAQSMNGNMQIRMYISNLGNDILGQGKHYYT